MSDWSLLEREWMSLPPSTPFQFTEYEPHYQQKAPPPPQMHYSSPPPTVTLLQVPPLSSPPPVPMPMPRTIPIQEQQAQLMHVPVPVPYLPSVPRGDNPREIRNKAEKLRRDTLNQSIAKLASMVPPVVAAKRKIDKTGVLRLTAHYLRAHQHVFGESFSRMPEFSSPSTRALLNFLNGFLITTTYKGLVVVVSQNIKQYLGYSELDLLGHNILNITHEDDRQMLKDQLMSKTQKFGPNGELLLPDDPERIQKVAEELASERRTFVIRLKKVGQRSEPSKYVTCHVEGSLRKSDGACRGYNHYCPMVRRARARGENPCSSGNDVVFVGVVRPTKETFITESALESYKMEYRTRHSIDGEIIQCEQRIALVTGYMTHEVSGINAMNFIHKDEVRWVIIALQEMYNRNQLYGESCYRLMTKNGQFIYLRTRGRLDVDKGSRAVTTFVCTNTMVDETEGKYLINLMKEKYSLAVNNNISMQAMNDDDDQEGSDSQKIPVESPRQLEKVILHLVTNLPSPEKNEKSSEGSSSDCGESAFRRLALIPPKKERIVSAIEKIHTVIKTMPKPRIQVTEIQSPSPPETDNSFKKPRVQVTEIQSPSPPKTDYIFKEKYLQTSNSKETDTTYSSGATNFEYANEMGDFNSLQYFPDIPEYQSDADPLLPAPSTSGMKRPNKFGDQEGITRKKMGVTLENKADESPSEGLTSLETLLDQACFNQEEIIESNV